MSARENHPGSPEEYYRRSLAISFLDHLKSEIESRFASHTVLAMKCLCIIPSCFSHQTANDDEIVEFFSSDLEYNSAAKAKLHLWRAYFKEQKQLPDTPQSALKHATPMLFPNIRKMLICIWYYQSHFVKQKDHLVHCAGLRHIYGQQRLKNN